MTDLHHDVSQGSPPAAQPERARRGARRTAWLLGGIAAALYLGFILTGVLGK